MSFSERVVEQPGDGLPESALVAVEPAYGVGSLAELLPSAGALLGVREMADVLGFSGLLSGVTRVGVLLVDGLGSYQLPLASKYSPMVAELAATAGMLTSGFPSTTPVSLVTLGTGTTPGAHGIVGFTVLGPGGKLVNHLHWDDDPDPLKWQPLPTVYERAAAAGVDVTAVSRPEFESGGLTVAASRGAKFVGACEWYEIADCMITALGAGDGPALVYGYYREVDKQGHEHGVDSPQWRESVAELDKLLDRIVHALPRGSALLVTADHGQLNVPVSARIDIDDFPELSGGLVALAGEPRVRYLHTAPGAAQDQIAGWREVLGERALVVGRDEAVANGWWGPVSADHLGRIGDVVIVLRGRNVLVAQEREPLTVANLVAYHGSQTAAEMSVPLLIARG